MNEQATKIKISNPVDATPIAYRIIDSHTGKQVGKDYSYENRNKARLRADKLDNEYGAYRYKAQPVYNNTI